MKEHKWRDIQLQVTRGAQKDTEQNNQIRPMSSNLDDSEIGSML